MRPRRSHARRGEPLEAAVAAGDDPQAVTTPAQHQAEAGEHLPGQLELGAGVRAEVHRGGAVDERPRGEHRVDLWYAHHGRARARRQGPVHPAHIVAGFVAARERRLTARAGPPPAPFTLQQAVEAPADAQLHAPQHGVRVGGAAPGGGRRRGGRPVGAGRGVRRRSGHFRVPPGAGGRRRGWRRAPDRGPPRRRAPRRRAPHGGAARRGTGRVHPPGARTCGRG